MSKHCLHKVNSKKFISDDPNEFGTLCWNVVVDRYGKDKPYYMQCELRIQDCTDTIHLDFYVGSNKENRLQSRLDKINCMIDSLNEMKTEMLKAGRKLDELNKDKTDD